MIRPVLFVALSTLLLAVTGTPDADAQLFKRKPKPPAYRQHRTAGGEFSLELPGDWTIGQAGAAAIAVLVSPKATVLVEQSVLRQPLSSDDVNQLFIDLEIDDLRTLMPGADQFRSELTTLSGRRAARLEFTRPGSSTPERVRLYVFPAGKKLFRVLLVADDSAFPAVTPVFERIVASLRLEMRAPD